MNKIILSKIKKKIKEIIKKTFKNKNLNEYNLSIAIIRMFSLCIASIIISTKSKEFKKAIYLESQKRFSKELDESLNKFIDFETLETLEHYSLSGFYKTLERARDSSRDAF